METIVLCGVGSYALIMTIMCIHFGMKTRF